MAERRADKLRAAIRRSVAGAARLAFEAEGLTGPVVPGDLFLLRSERPTALRWLVLRRDPLEPELLFIIPGDGSGLAGPRDVAAPEQAASGPLTLRPRLGFWVQKSELDLELRIGRVDQGTCFRALAQLEESLFDPLRSSPGRLEVEASQDFREWMAQVTTWAREARSEHGVERSQADERWSSFARRPPWLMPLGEVRLAAAASNHFELEEDLEAVGYGGSVKVSVRLEREGAGMGPGILVVEWSASFFHPDGWHILLVDPVDRHVLFREPLSGGRRGRAVLTTESLGFDPTQVGARILVRPSGSLEAG